MSDSSEYSSQEDNENDCEQDQEDQIVVSDSEDDGLDLGDTRNEVYQPDYIDECPVNESHFDFIKKLGTGAFGTVFLVRKNCGVDVNKRYAIKVIAKEEVVKVPKTIIHMKAERRVLEMIRGCPFIPNLYYAFQTADKLFLVIDYIPGGEMFTLLQRAAIVESSVRFYVAELIIALEHIHKHGIVYRDIKLENILLDAAGHIKLVDFGLCKKIGSRGRTKSFCGTVEYMAPEVIACTGHSLAADWWALGVLTIELLTTVTPFGVSETPDGNAIMEKITNDGPIMPDNITEEMRDFILKMLQKDPDQRLGGSEILATEIKRHPLFNEIDWDKLEKKQLPTPEIPDITDENDTKNFSEEFTQQSPTYEPTAVPPETFWTFRGYSYIASDLDPRESNQDADRSIDENLNSLHEIFYNREENSEFDRKYRFVSKQPMGIGKTSVCMECVDLSNKTRYAVKIYKREKQCDNQIDVLRKAAAKKLTGVVKLIEVLTDSTWTYLIMERVTGVNLIDHLSKISYRGNTVHQTFSALLNIVKSVHSLNYVHKRICFKNFYCINDKSTDFRLIGFSNATPITHPHDENIDFWSIGVCLYTLLCGHSPFDMKTRDSPTRTERIENGEFDQHSAQWESLNNATKHCIEQLLCTSPPVNISNELKCISSISLQRVNNSKEQLDENEDIVSKRAESVQKYPIKIMQLPINGLTITTNGNNVIESLDVIPITSQEENHSDEESHNNLCNGNGHVGRISKKRLNNIKTEILAKKKKTENSDELPAQLLQDHQIKKERLPTSGPVTRSLVANERKSYKQTSLKTKQRSQLEVKIKKEKVPSPENVKKNVPKNLVAEPKPRGRPKKNVALLVKKEHPTPSPRNTRKRLKNEIKFVPPIIRPIKEINQTSRAVQTDPPTLWVYTWPLVKPKPQQPHCFERYDYDKN